MREAGNRRCGAMLACMDKLQGRIAGMPRDAANLWAGVLGVRRAHINHSEALQEFVARCLVSLQPEQTAAP